MHGSLFRQGKVLNKVDDRYMEPARTRIMHTRCDWTDIGIVAVSRHLDSPHSGSEGAELSNGSFEGQSFFGLEPEGYGLAGTETSQGWASQEREITWGLFFWFEAWVLAIGGTGLGIPLFRPESGRSTVPAPRGLNGLTETIWKMKRQTQAGWAPTG